MKARRTSQAGYAVVLVLWGLTALSAIALNISKGERLEALRDANIISALQADQLASSGVDAAAAWLHDHGSTGLLAAAGGQTLDVGDAGTVHFRALPAQALLDLNHAPVDWLVAAFIEAGVSPYRADALGRAIEDRRRQVEKSGATAFRDIFSLAQLPDINAEEADTAMQYVTVYNGTPRVHLATAPEAVLRAIPDIDLHAADLLVSQRDPALVNGRGDNVGGENVSRFGAAAGPVYHLFVEGRSATGAVSKRMAVVFLSDDPALPHTVLSYGAGPGAQR